MAPVQEDRLFLEQLPCFDLEERHVTRHRAPRCICRLQRSCCNDPEPHLPTGEPCLGKEGTKPAGPLPWHLAGIAAMQHHGLREAHAMLPLPPVPQVTWSMTCPCWQGSFRSTEEQRHSMCSPSPSAVILLCCHLIEEAHRPLHRWDQSSLKTGLQSHAEVPYVQQYCTAQISSKQGSISLHKL